MKALTNISILVLLFSNIASSIASGGICGEFEKGEVPQSVVYSADHKTSYVITQKSIYLLLNGKVSKFYSGTENIYCAEVNDSSIWLGSDNGVNILNLNNFSITNFPVDLTVKAYKVVSIFKNADKVTYIATDAYGLYEYNSAGKISKINTLFPINKGIATADSSIWIGTDAGLFKGKNNDWIRYNEEGVANFEIPDNIVQNLIIDNQNFLWILMREGVAVMEVDDSHHKQETSGEDAHGHIPSVKFLGKPENTIYDLHFYKKKGYVFATDMGLLWMAVSNEDELLENFHHSSSERVENKQLLVMPNVAAINNSLGKILYLVEQGNRNYFVCERGVYTLSTKEIAGLLTIPFTK